jgi:hypothetical protein
LRQQPGHQTGRRTGRKVLIRTDSAGATHDLLNWLVAQRLSYSVGFTLPESILDDLAKVPVRPARQLVAQDKDLVDQLHRHRRIMP